MSQPIEAAPKDGSLILLEDETSGAYEIASWSSEAGTWIGKNGKLSKVAASHWLPIPSETWSRASAAPDHAQRGWRRRVAILTIPSLLLACFIVAPYRHEIRHLFSRSLDVLSREEGRPMQSLLQFKADQPGTAAAEAGPTGRAATVLPLDAHHFPEIDDQSRRALQAERERSPASATEVEMKSSEAEARVGQSRRLTNDAKLQEHAAAGTISALRQSLQEERDKFAVLQKETSAVRQAMLADDEEHRRELEGARARYGALASELAGVRREIDLRAAPPPQAADQAAQWQALESTVAELRRSLQQEREKTATLLMESENLRLTIAANSEQHQRALDREQQRSAALADELTSARSESEQQAASSRKAEEEVEQKRQALESTANELRHAMQEDGAKIATLEKRASAAAREAIAIDEQYRRALDEERGRRAALTKELAGARLELETQAALVRTTRDQTAQQRQEAERAVTETHLLSKRNQGANERSTVGVAITERTVNRANQSVATTSLTKGGKASASKDVLTCIEVDFFGQCRGKGAAVRSE